jgi:hypothetical protein
MDEQTAAMMATSVLFGAAIWIVKLVLDARTRNRLIEKGMVTADYKLPALSGADTLSWLRWGVVLTGAGVAVTLRALLPETASPELGLGVVVTTIGLSVLVAYWAGERASRNRGDRG